MLGVTKLFEVDNGVPPVASAYQTVLPALEVALSVTVPALHLLLGVVAVMAGVVFTVAITGTLEEAQVPETLST